MTKYMIIDDEPLAHDLIKNYCDRLPFLELSVHCYDALEALEYLSSNQIGLIFLDLNMPKLKGFEFLRTLQNAPKVIVTTAYKEHALEGFELAVGDYLVKPFSFERFLKAVNKVLSSDEKSSSNDDFKETEHMRFFVKGEKRHHQINTKELLYVEAFGNYTKLFLDSGMIVAHEKISDLESLLSEDSFLRVHRSFIVSLTRIETIQGNRIFIGESEVPIGQTFSKIVQDRVLGN